jgi:hypothetical protein
MYLEFDKIYRMALFTNETVSFKTGSLDQTTLECLSRLVIKVR